MTYEEQLEIEDFLQEQGVFVNGISGKTAHSDSYMTIVDPENLWKALEADYDWIGFKESVMESPNKSIPMKIVCALITGVKGERKELDNIKD